MVERSCNYTKDSKKQCKKCKTGKGTETPSADADTTDTDGDGEAEEDVLAL